MEEATGSGMGQAKALCAATTPNLARPRSEPCLRRHSPAMEGSIEAAPAVEPAADVAAASAASCKQAAPEAPLQQSISSWDPFTLFNKGRAAVMGSAASRQPPRLSLSSRQRRLRGLADTSPDHRDRDAQPAPLPMAPPLSANSPVVSARPSNESSASQKCRASEDSRSGRDGPAALWEHVAAKSRHGVSSTSHVHHASQMRRSHCQVPIGDGHSSEDDMVAFDGGTAGNEGGEPHRVSSSSHVAPSERSFMQANNSRLPSPGAAAAARLNTVRQSALFQQCATGTVRERATAERALLHDAASHGSCSGSESSPVAGGRASTSSVSRPGGRRSSNAPRSAVPPSRQSVSRSGGQSNDRARLASAPVAGEWYSGGSIVRSSVDASGGMPVFGTEEMEARELARVATADPHVRSSSPAHAHHPRLKA